MSDSGGRKAAGADQARRLTSSTEADWGGRSHGGPGHGVALPAAGGGWALSGAQGGANTTLCFAKRSDLSHSQTAHRTGAQERNNLHHPGWAHTTVGPRPGPRAPGRAPPPVARLPGLPGCPLRELELGNTTLQDRARALDNQQALDRVRLLPQLWQPRDEWALASSVALPPFLILAEGRPEAQSGFLDLGLWLAYGYK